MATYVQLELFDLEAYGEKQSSTDDSNVSQLKEKSKKIEFKQLELDLFPKPSNGGTNLKQAA